MFLWWFYVIEINLCKEHFWCRIRSPFKTSFEEDSKSSNPLLKAFNTAMQGKETSWSLVDLDSVYIIKFPGHLKPNFKRTKPQPYLTGTPMSGRRHMFEVIWSLILLIYLPFWLTNLFCFWSDSDALVKCKMSIKGQVQWSTQRFGKTSRNLDSKSDPSFNKVCFISCACHAGHELA